MTLVPSFGFSNAYAEEIPSMSSTTPTFSESLGRGIESLGRDKYRIFPENTNLFSITNSGPVSGPLRAKYESKKVLRE